MQEISLVALCYGHEKDLEPAIRGQIHRFFFIHRCSINHVQCLTKTHSERFVLFAISLYTTSGNFDGQYHNKPAENGSPSSYFHGKVLLINFSGKQSEKQTKRTIAIEK